MNRTDYLHVCSERETVCVLLANTPEEEVIDHLSLEGRLANIEAAMAQAAIDEFAPARQWLLDNLQEKECTLSGVFLGVLPKSRMFEFALSGQDEVIRGKVAAAVQGIEEINHHGQQTVTVRVMETRVGKGKPRYLLLALPTWQQACASTGQAPG